MTYSEFSKFWDETDFRERKVWHIETTLKRNGIVCYSISGCELLVFLDDGVFTTDYIVKDVHKPTIKVNSQYLFDTLDAQYTEYLRLKGLLEKHGYIRDNGPAK